MTTASHQQTTILTRITQTPDQCGGRPCIREMRIRVSDILEMLGLGVSRDEILADFPDLEPENIQACLLFAAKLTQSPQRLEVQGDYAMDRLEFYRDTIEKILRQHAEIPIAFAQIDEYLIIDRDSFGKLR